MAKLAQLLSLIKFEHTLFALPFALAAAFVAAKGIPTLATLGWILLAMVGARSAAMAFNRIVDRKIDAENPRTKNRELPRGIVTIIEAWGIVFAGSVALIFAAWRLNPLAFALSPVALLVIFGYSFTKRFTSFSHLVLGLSLGIAPIGAWIAVRGEITLEPIILTAAVMLWTAGFDILYALQDVSFDKTHGLFSLPKTLGVKRAIFVSRIFHTAAIFLLIGFGILCSLGVIYYIGVFVVAAALIYEHRLVKENDLSKIDVAFFTMNGFVSVAFAIFTITEQIIASFK